MPILFISRLLYQMTNVALNLFDFFFYQTWSRCKPHIIYINTESLILRLIRDRYAYKLQIVSEIDFFHSGLKA